MAPGSSSSAGTQKMIEKLKKSVEAGAFYEAQQMYKGVYARYMGQKKYTEAKELLLSGACTQLQHGQVTCGSELGILLVEAFTATETPCDSASLGSIREIYDCFPRREGSAASTSRGGEGSSEDEKRVSEEGTRVQSCVAFLKAAIRWSAAHGGPKAGAPELHDMMADYLWTQSSKKDLAAASKHFIHGSKPEAFASALVDTMRECSRSEIDLVLARGVLQYLAIGNLRDANTLFDDVHQRAKSFAAPPLPDSPLLHFTNFLLLTLERDALPLFRILRNRYRPSIERDPTFDEYLDEIALRFYRVPKPTGMGGMLGDMMKMLSAQD